MDILRRFWIKLRHPNALGQFDESVTKSFGHATAIACACTRSEVEAIHVLYGLLKTNALGMSEGNCVSSVDALERSLAPDDDAPTVQVPPNAAVRRLVQELVADAQQGGRFFISGRDLARGLASLRDPRVEEFARTRCFPGTASHRQLHITVGARRCSRTGRAHRGFVSHRNSFYG